MEEKKYYLPVEKVDYLKAHIATLKEQNRSDHESNEFDSYNWRNEGRYKAYEEVLQWVIEGSLTPGLPPLPEPILTDRDVKDWEGEKDEQYIKGTDTVTITMTNMNHPLAKKMAVWVKASVKLPPNPDDPNNHYRLKGHRVTGNFYEDTDKMVCFEVRGTTHGAYSISSKLFHYLEWLDESEPAPAEWDSIRLIGRVKERFKELEEKQHDWRSFYCAWLEGRVDMLQQIKGYGRLSQDRADLIREANNRDLEGVAGREEDALSKEVIDFIRDIAENWDCDEDGHKYNTGCRKCSASELYYELSKQQKEK